jgi:hypothetical protein
LIQAKVHGERPLAQMPPNTRDAQINFRASCFLEVRLTFRQRTFFQAFAPSESNANVVPKIAL